jgi:hypothetical protein
MEYSFEIKSASFQILEFKMFTTFNVTLQGHVSVRVIYEVRIQAPATQNFEQIPGNIAIRDIRIGHEISAKLSAVTSSSGEYLRIVY